MIVKDLGEVFEVSMVHVVNIGKKDPVFNFRRYLQTLQSEFEQEIARTVYPAMPATVSHLIIPDG